MKILILSQYWAPENGVPQRRWSWLSRILIEQGHQVTVVAPPPHYDRKISFRVWLGRLISDGLHEDEIGSAGERILRSPYLPAGRSLTSRAFNQAFVGLGAASRLLWRRGSLKGYEPDVIIGTVPALPISVVVWFAGAIYQRPYIVDLRDAWPDLLDQVNDWNAGMGGPSVREKLLSRGPLQVVSKVTRMLMNGSLRNANGIIATSERLADDLQLRPELRGKAFSREIVTIRNVFPSETEISSRNSTFENTGELKILYAGTIGRAQNLKNALDAVRIARSSGAKIKLRIVGSGAEKKALQNSSMDLMGSVEFESARPADELAEYYEWADTALVHLTDWEPLVRTVPSKVYELLDSGIHISAVVQGETAQLITKLRAGHVVEPDSPEALAELWINLAGKPQMLSTSDAGRDWVKYQREVVVPETVMNLLKRVRGK
ncbi:glycosyltransferase family 4 protein [Corynebacterium casei]|uniref:glycosyltransferase family 4 protein n=1 Tax=Corynebacterium casei TaxID=160386 RepID=UPI003FCF6DA2